MPRDRNHGRCSANVIISFKVSSLLIPIIGTATLKTLSDGDEIISSRAQRWEESDLIGKS